MSFPKVTLLILLLEITDRRGNVIPKLPPPPVQSETPLLRKRRVEFEGSAAAPAVHGVPVPLAPPTGTRAKVKVSPKAKGKARAATKQPPNPRTEVLNAWEREPLSIEEKDVED